VALVVLILVVGVADHHVEIIAAAMVALVLL
jgi:hypothetical protein